MRDLNARDLNARDINGNIFINDNSTEHKLLIHCSNEELLDEEIHRAGLLKKERSYENIKMLKFLCLSALILVVAATWFYIQDQMNTVTFLLGVAGISIGGATLQKSDRPTQFEERQIEALNEINMTLRERGIR